MGVMPGFSDYTEEEWAKARHDAEAECGLVLGRITKTSSDPVVHTVLYKAELNRQSSELLRLREMLREGLALAVNSQYGYVFGDGMSRAEYADRSVKFVEKAQEVL